MTVLTGENRSPTGGADRIGSETAVETNSFLRYPVQVGSLDKMAAVSADSLTGVVVRQNENNIRSGTQPPAGNEREKRKEA